MKLLVVEDELYAREALIHQIRKLDEKGRFEILPASNGESGLQLFREHRPELVLTDIRMPKLDGLQLLARIHEENPETKVVMLSAYSDFAYAREALVHGASDYLLKPVKDDELARCLELLAECCQTRAKEMAAPDPEEKKAGPADGIVARMTEYVEQNYSMDVTVRELAEQVLFLNQNYVSHLFAEKKGVSFSAFLRQVRMRHAKELLAGEKWSVTEVASRVGYNDTSQFIRIFRNETGMTPKKYRDYIRKGGGKP